MKTLKPIFSAIFLFTLCALTLISCKSEEQKVKEECLKVMQIYFPITLKKEVKDFLSIDSMRIIRIDTLTEKHVLGIAFMEASEESQRYLRLAEISNDLAKYKRMLADIGSSQDSHWNELIGDSNERAKLEIDSAKFYLDKMKSIQQDITKADSLTLKYYGVEFQIQYTKKDMTFDRINGVVPITKDFRIVEYDQIINEYLKPILIE